MKSKNIILLLWKVTGIWLLSTSLLAIEANKRKLPSKISVIEINKEFQAINAMIQWYFAYQSQIHEKNPQEQKISVARKFINDTLKTDATALNLEKELKSKVSSSQLAYLDKFLHSPLPANINLREHQFFDPAQQVKVLERLIENPTFNLNPERQQLLRILDLQSDTTAHFAQLFQVLAQAFFPDWVIPESDKAASSNWKKKLQRTYQNQQHLLYETFSNEELAVYLQARNHPAFFLYLQTIFQRLIAATTALIPVPVETTTTGTPSGEPSP